MHGRIYQISIKPINKSDYITENSYKEYQYNSFADYIDCTDDKERQENLRWGFTDAGIFEYKEGHVYYKGITARTLNEWAGNIKALAEKLNAGNILDFSRRYKLEKLLKNPLESAHRFVIYKDGRDYCGSPVNTDDVIEYFYCAQKEGEIKPGDEVYIGGILDYHI